MQDRLEASLEFKADAETPECQFFLAHLQIYQWM